MQTSRSWIWIAGGAVLVSAAAVAVYFAQSPAQAGAEEALPVRAPSTAVQTSSNRVNVLIDSENAPVVQDKRLGRYDKNKNQIVERREFLASRQKSFDKLDSSGDGKLSFEEYALKTSQKFDAADANRNGNLEQTEFVTTARPPSKKKCDCQADDDK
jgi:EF hand